MSQLPSAEMEPMILTVWPTVVVTISLKVTATEVAEAQAAEVLLDFVVLREVLVGEAVEDTGGVEPPPVMAISAQVR